MNHEKVNALKNEARRKSAADMALRDAVTHHTASVLDWRKSEFRRMGWKPEDADFLALTRIELQLVRDLHSKGATHGLIEGMLLGTCPSGEDDIWWDQWLHPHIEVEDEVEEEVKVKS